MSKVQAGKWVAIAGIVGSVSALGVTGIETFSNSSILRETNIELQETVDTLEVTLSLAQRAVAENKELIRDLDREFAVLEGRLRGFEIADRLLIARTADLAE